MPAPLTQLLSRTVYATDGVTTTWDFSFSGGYLDKAHVKAYIELPTGERTDLTITNPLFTGPYQLFLSPALAAGSTLTIYRDTPKDLPLVDFADEGGLSEIALDTMAKQSIFVAAETVDTVNTGSTYDAEQAADQAATAAAAAAASAVAAQEAADSVGGGGGGGSVGTLQQVTTAGNTTSNPISFTGTGGPSGAPVTIGRGNNGAFSNWLELNGIAGVINNGAGAQAVTPLASLDNIARLGADGLRWNTVYTNHTNMLGNLVWNNLAIPAPTGSTTTFLCNDGTWATPAGGGGGGSTAKVITVMGDSISDAHSARTASWPQIMEDLIRSAGDDVVVRNVAIGGSSTLTMLADTTYGGTTMLARAIATDPDIVIIQVGYNDATRNPVDSTADFASIVSQLKVAKPTVKVVFAQELVYDKTNFATPASLKNKGVLPYNFTLLPTGLTANTYSEAAMEGAVSATIKGYLANLDTMNTNCAANPQLTGSFVQDYWRVARLGGLQTDGLHPTLGGMQLIAHNILTGLVGIAGITEIPKFKAMSSNILGRYATLFTDLLAQSGDGWVNKAATVATASLLYELSLEKKFNPSSWFYPYLTRFARMPSSGNNVPAHLVIENGPPNTVVEVSYNGAAFAHTSVSTTASGNALIDFPWQYAGPNNLVRVGNEVYGPFSLASLATVELSETGNVVLGLNRPAQTTYIDMRSSGSASADVRIAATGGTGSQNGTLTLHSANVTASGSLTANGALSAGSVTTAGALSAASVTTAGSVSAGSVTTTGSVSAGSLSASTAAAGSLTVGGLSIVNTSLGLVPTVLSLAGTVGVVPGTAIAPTNDAAYSCGGNSARWSEVWAASGTINTSDKRAKKAVKTEVLGLDFISKLRPVSYKWRKGTDTTTVYHGFIAQEVEALLDGASFAAKPETGALYGMRYTEFIAPLTKAVQELLAINKALTARVKRLEDDTKRSRK